MRDGVQVGVLSARGAGCALFAAAALSVACGPPRYVPPAVDEPHAQVTLRVLHHALPGPILHHETLLNGDAIPVVTRGGASVGVPLTRGVRVRPGRGAWQFSSRFAHVEQLLRTVYETERYPCGTRLGTTGGVETRTCTRQVPRQRWEAVQVPDGSCSAGFVLQATHGRRYLLQYDFYAHDQCRARCFSQQGTDGAVQLVPCGSPGASAPAPARPPSAGGTTPAGQLTSPSATGY